MANFSTLKEKILAFLAEMGIRKVDFFESTGIQSSNFKGANVKSAPGGDMLVKILTLYPQLSAEWLMRGEGDMLREHNYIPIKTITEPDKSKATPKEFDNSADPIIDKFMGKITEQAEEIGRLKERIAQLEREKNDSGATYQSVPQRETVDSL